MTGIRAIAARFALSGPVTAVEPLAGGLINDTYRVVTRRAEGVLQRINRAVFPQPAKLMANLRRLGEHWDGLSAPGLRVPRLIPLRDGRDWWQDSGGGDWRMLEHIDGVPPAGVATPAEAEALGWSLGRFHCLLADLDPDDWHDTLPGLHATSRYLAALDRARGRWRGPVSRPLASLFAWIERQRGWALGLDQARRAGRLPLRIVHGDPKLDNLLLDPRTGRPLAWVDLDTVKPGLIHHDIGDCLRSACQVEAGRFELGVAAAVLRGWFAEVADILRAGETDWVPDAIRLLPFELGVRFLADYLDGNRYFKVSDPEENLHRALAQFALTRAIRRQEAALRALWRALSAAPGR